MAVTAGKVSGAEILAQAAGRRLELIRAFYSIDPDEPE
jgi:hypothetical protein